MILYFIEIAEKTYYLWCSLLNFTYLQQFWSVSSYKFYNKMISHIYNNKVGLSALSGVHVIIHIGEFCVTSAVSSCIVSFFRKWLNVLGLLNLKSTFVFCWVSSLSSQAVTPVILSSISSFYGVTQHWWHSINSPTFSSSIHVFLLPSIELDTYI